MSDSNYLRILVIDDNPDIHTDFIKILSQKQHDGKIDDLDKLIFWEDEENINQKNHSDLLPGFKIDSAYQGLEGVECIRKAINENNSYSLAFVDIKMPPGIDGIETIKKIWAIDPEIQIVICTAYSDYTWEDTVNALGKKENLLILKKPFDTIAVRQLACALTKKWQLAQEAKQYTCKLESTIKNRTLSLEKSLSLVKATLESSSDGILVISNQNKVMDYNNKLIELWGIPEEELRCNANPITSDHFLLKLVNPTKFTTVINELNKNKTKSLIDIFKLKNGSVFELYSQPYWLNDQIIGRIYNFRDTTERATLEEKLEYQATHDALTNLPNRVLFLRRTEDAIIESKKSGKLASILFIDLDRFKLINDSLSHLIGDRVLQESANRLQKAVRDQDTLARMGGDEFVVLISDLKSESELTPIIQRVKNVFAAPYIIDDRKLFITASIGISIYPMDGETIDVLLKNSDISMYVAKTRNGTSVQRYSFQLNKRNSDKLDFDTELRQALDKHQLFLKYQPQVDVNSGRIVAVEALIRWKHPSKGILLPIDFIPLSEETGLIVEIGQWVLEEACRQNKTLQNKGLDPIRISVNVTAQQFAHNNMAKLVKAILDKTGLEAKYLELELTENTIANSNNIITTLKNIKKLGVSIAIDDFGTGYSSLSYLHQIPLDRLKIDGSFIKEINSHCDDDVIIRAIISIAKNLKLKVIAEGVETRKQLEYLKAQKCSDLQGYYLSHPLSAEELEKYILNQNKIILDEIET